MKLHHALAGLIVAGGIAAGSLSASAAPLTSSPAAAAGINAGNALVEEVHYRRYPHRHRGWHRGHRGPSIYFGFGPRWGYGHRRHHWRHRGW